MNFAGGSGAEQDSIGAFWRAASSSTTSVTILWTPGNSSSCPFHPIAAGSLAKIECCVRLGLSVDLGGILVAGLLLKAAIELNCDKRMIHSDKCLACHGPDAANAAGYP